MLGKAILLFSEHLINFSNQFYKSGGVLLFRGLLAKLFKTLSCFTIHVPKIASRRILSLFKTAQYGWHDDVVTRTR